MKTTTKNLIFLTAILGLFIGLPIIKISPPLLAENVVQNIKDESEEESEATQESENVVPKVDDKPGTEPGGTRDDCIVGDKPLTALIPVTGNPNKIGLTVNGHPTLFIYIPETKAVDTDFVLVDENNQKVYQTNLEIGEFSGVISIDIPDSSPPLEVGKSYKWTFSLICNPSNRNEDIYVNGLVQRLNPKADLVVNLKEATPEEIPNVYAQGGIWHETLSSLAELILENPKEDKFKQEWEKMLESVGLEDVAKEPLIEL